MSWLIAMKEKGFEEDDEGRNLNDCPRYERQDVIRIATSWTKTVRAHRRSDCTCDHSGARKQWNLYTSISVHGNRNQSTASSPPPAPAWQKTDFPSLSYLSVHVLTSDVLQD